MGGIRPDLVFLDPVTGETIRPLGDAEALSDEQLAAEARRLGLIRQPAQPAPARSRKRPICAALPPLSSDEGGWTVLLPRARQSSWSPRMPFFVQHAGQDEEEVHVVHRQKTSRRRPWVLHLDAGKKLLLACGPQARLWTPGPREEALPSLQAASAWGRRSCWIAWATSGASSGVETGTPPLASLQSRRPGEQQPPSLSASPL